MKRYDIVVPRQDPKDPEKKYWNQVGRLVEFEPTAEKPERGFILELNMFPNTTFKVFPQRPRTQTTEQGVTASNDGVDAPAPEETVVDDIPY
jgi:hypothetical protein